jgi:hypothetical protein
MIIDDVDGIKLENDNESTKKLESISNYLIDFNPIAL